MTATTERPVDVIDETETALPTNVIGRLQLVQQAIRAVAKTGHYEDDKRGIRYDFRGVDAVVNAVGPALRDYGVLVVPHRVEPAYQAVAGNNRNMRECTVLVTYRFYGWGPEDYVDVQTPGESLDTSDKGTAKAMSVAFRILFLQSLSLPTSEPKDPDDEHLERPVKSDRDDEAVGKWIAQFASWIEHAPNAESLDRLFAIGKMQQDTGIITIAEANGLAQRIIARRAALEAEGSQDGDDKPAGLRDAQLPDPDSQPINADEAPGHGDYQ